MEAWTDGKDERMVDINSEQVGGGDVYKIKKMLCWNSMRIIGKICCRYKKLTVTTIKANH